jgi:Ca2+-binding RTX toxin-like protein
MTQTLDNNPNSLDLNLPGFGPDTVYGRQGADTITSSTQGGSLIYGEEGNDSLIAKGPKDTLYGGPDEDILRSLQTPAYLDGEAGADVLIAQATATLHGGAGDDYVQGTAQANSLFGDAANDTLIGGAVGTDTLYGGKGNDVLGFFTANGGVNVPGYTALSPVLGSGNQGSNFMRGDLGDDSLYAINQRDSLYGGKDNDTLLGAGSYSYLSGDEGNDAVLYNQNTTINAAGSTALLTYEKVTLIGGAGDDSIIGPIGPITGSKNLIAGDAIDGTTPVGTTPGTTGGNDTLVTYGKQDTVLGGAGNDSITSQTAAGVNSDFVPLSTDGYFGKNILDGGDGNDTITAASITDTMIGGTGNDALSGLFTSASGGDGNDTIDATANGTLPATLDGGNGDDYLKGKIGLTGPNLFAGGAGNDTIFYGTTGDKLIGDLSGNDYISATSVSFSTGNSTPVVMFDNTGNNFFLGSSTVDSIVGGAGNDFLFGDVGNDTLLGADGNNTLAGGDGNDNIVGGSGNDSIIGLSGSDGMSGGAGSDSFVYFSSADGANFATGSTNTNPDFIGDYDPTVDKLLINTTGFSIGVGVNPAETNSLDVNFTQTSMITGNVAVVAYDTNSGNVWFFQNGFDAALTGGKIVPTAADTLLANLTNKPASIRNSVQFF